MLGRAVRLIGNYLIWEEGARLEEWTRAYLGSKVLAAMALATVL